jgi:hypothetical protein
MMPKAGDARATTAPESVTLAPRAFNLKNIPNPE